MRRTTPQSSTCLTEACRTQDFIQTESIDESRHHPWLQNPFLAQLCISPMLVLSQGRLFWLISFNYFHNLKLFPESVWSSSRWKQRIWCTQMKDTLHWFLYIYLPRGKKHSSTGASFSLRKPNSAICHSSVTRWHLILLLSPQGADISALEFTTWSLLENWNFIPAYRKGRGIYELVI